MNSGSQTYILIDYTHVAKYNNILILCMLCLHSIRLYRKCEFHNKLVLHVYNTKMAATKACKVNVIIPPGP